LSDCLDEFSIWIESQSLTDPTTLSLNKKERAVSGPLFGMASGLGEG